MLEEEGDHCLLARKPVLNFLANRILNEQFSSASLNRIIWIAQL